MLDLEPDFFLLRGTFRGWARRNAAALAIAAGVLVIVLAGVLL